MSPLRKTVMAVLGSALFLFLGACGREVPEGYAKVRVSLGSGDSSSTRSLNNTSACTVPHLYVRAYGPDMPGPLRIQLFPTVDLTAFASASQGAELFSPISADLLLLKGVQRRLSIYGVIFSNCDFGTSYPIFGSTKDIYINGPMDIPVDAVVWSQGLGIQDSANAGGVSMVDVSQTQFVMLELDWGAANFGSGDRLWIHEQEADFRVTPPVAGLGAGISALTQLTQVGPLFPNRAYRFDVVNSGDSTRNKSFKVLVGQEQFQKIVVP